MKSELIIKIRPLGFQWEVSNPFLFCAHHLDLYTPGKPIHEPVVSYGPFVMNTSQEISQAITDYRATEFSGWPWSRPDRVHDRNSGRFALFTNGNLEKKPKNDNGNQPNGSY